MFERQGTDANEQNNEQKQNQSASTELQLIQVIFDLDKSFILRDTTGAIIPKHVKGTDAHEIFPAAEPYQDMELHMFRFPAFNELLQYLLIRRKDKARLSFFSAACKESNKAVVDRLLEKIPAENSSKDDVRVFSQDEMAGGRNGQKDLIVTLNESFVLSCTFLIDDTENIVPLEQKNNHLKIQRVEREDFDLNLFSSYSLKRANQQFMLAALLHQLLEVENPDNLLARMSALQWEAQNRYWNYCYMGYEILKSFNSELKMYQHDRILSWIEIETENRLRQENAANNANDVPLPDKTWTAGRFAVSEWNTNNDVDALLDDAFNISPEDIQNNNAFSP